METSAKEGININEVFDDIVERIDKVFGNIPKHQKKINYISQKKVNAVIKQMKNKNFF